jgi:periplasmic protein TonB
LIVDFIPPPQIEQPVAPKPLPTRQQLVKQQRAAPPKAPAPLIETTQSTVSEPTAPVVSQTETRPTPAVPPAEPVTQPRFDADYLKNPAPPYPPLSRRMGEEGKVILRVVVSPQGSAESVDVKTSSGSTRLDEAAQKSVRNWRFIPAKRGDAAIQSAVLVPIIFKLEK